MSFHRFTVLFIVLAVFSSFPPFAQSAGDNPRFAEVGEKLDQGGSMYLYLDVKDKLRQLFDTAKEFILASDESEETRKGLGIVEQVLDSLGLFAIEDIGTSTAKVGENYQLKHYLRIPGERKGLFKVLGGAPHALDMMGQAPANTVLFRSFDFDLSALYDLVREIALKVGGPEALAGIDEALQAGGDPGGAKVPEVIRSLSGKWTFFLALDDSAQFTIPDSEPPIIIPQPKLVIVVSTKDETLYKALCGIFPNPEKVEKLPDGTEVKIRDIQIPESEKIPLSPRFAYDGKQVMLLSHGDLLDYPLGLTKDKPTLADNGDFKALMADLPKEGNDLAFVSPRLWATIQKVLKQIPPEAAGEGPMNPKAISALLEGSPLATGLAAVRINDQGGLYVVVSSPSELGLAIVLGVGAKVGGVLGAIFGGASKEAPRESKEEAAEEEDTSEEAGEVEEATEEETETVAPAERPLSAENESATDEER